MSDIFRERTFMDLYCDDRAVADEIDDFIGNWHEQAPMKEGGPIPLHDYLGMTRDEYEAWVHDAFILPSIVRARMCHTSLDRYR
jgi:hypothetical protein